MSGIFSGVTAGGAIVGTGNAGATAGIVRFKIIVNAGAIAGGAAIAAGMRVVSVRPAAVNTGTVRAGAGAAGGVAATLIPRGMGKGAKKGEGTKGGIKVTARALDMGNPASNSIIIKQNIFFLIRSTPPLSKKLHVYY
ncbi:MAG: hypothetical protein ACMUIP_08420 [bacterium]